MRLFEATGAGACLITDRKVNLPAMFEPDVEVVTYSSVEECSEKVRYLLESLTASGKVSLPPDKNACYAIIHSRTGPGS